ncbi:MAG: tRNA (adenosine(37)-N6)-threonylcarbamoyltransferase complex transferase subunit TsaD [candidate division KSB1 bacterium]|nr:tRNA (adenosine(37)-N6)-threonylcarbamoyltransferase complex transferase subunit TsaD [candidate division KSB1 bacterium]MDZ7274783.1 tRNA (adenosine(37)-N6)-threonylcarbamoyltransferase complex transferase subunit TsaD [candidate division KSB1 bacterium]MDZ7285607.1 tRNA (adenosine(37)-N6)-threonylcarbamoyltransferase complex transferase subunit TsaD [candidate division KSB1 bacterium]MDZ7298639.1 tRNA (adenosine(37)-N6)-threonylcarbamoyltransferase complex transferase subunit TsaD [candidat
MRLLAIETSCDETAAAVMAEDRLLSNVVASQEIHQLYGGVVPELASRAHLRQIATVVGLALERAGLAPRHLDAIAVTRGPGLIGSLLVGLNFAKGLALDLGVPLLGINHLEGHLVSNNVSPGGPQPPFLVLIVSGGHSILALVRGWGQYRILGETQDDAAGEAFDKVARILGLPYPGGPQIEKLAATGNPHAIAFPIARLKDAPFDFSFSGLKTAVLYHVQKPGTVAGPQPHHATADVAASFQQALIGALVGTTARALEQFPVTAIALAGGVACNKALRAAMADMGRQHGVKVFYPPPTYCTDNAAMIARAAMFYLTGGAPLPATVTDLTPDPSLKLTSTMPASSHAA